MTNTLVFTPCWHTSGIYLSSWYMWLQSPTNFLSSVMIFTTFTQPCTRKQERTEKKPNHWTKRGRRDRNLKVVMLSSWMTSTTPRWVTDATIWPINSDSRCVSSSFQAIGRLIWVGHGILDWPWFLILVSVMYLSCNSLSLYLPTPVFVYTLSPRLPLAFSAMLQHVDTSLHDTLTCLCNLVLSL